MLNPMNGRKVDGKIDFMESSAKDSNAEEDEFGIGRENDLVPGAESMKARRTSKTASRV